MRIGRQTNGWNEEALMVSALQRYLLDRNITHQSEVSIPEVGRRADILAISNGLVNIEAKCNDYKTMMEQLGDHSLYCDYCFAYITDIGFTPRWFKEELMERGYGLIVYNTKTDTVTEVLEAHHNKPRLRELRHKHLLQLRVPKLEETCW